jgi:tRNA-Thr(GGU) m(6)t(6)A37 methyltransferase TsaA
MDAPTLRITVRPIGVIHSPFLEAAGTPIQASMAPDVEGWVELSEEYAPGLRDLEGFERIWLVYWFHRAATSDTLVVTPYLDTAAHGVFATRAPVRPNPIGLSCVHLARVERNILRIRGVDVLDGTPLLDIKPYAPRFDSFADAAAGWLDAAAGGLRVADSRFEQGRR